MKQEPVPVVPALFVFGLSWLVSWDVCFWWGALMIGAAHLGIDIWKSYREDNVVWFTLDQALHLLVIAGVAYAWSRCHDWCLPFDVELRHVAVVVVLFVCWKPANFFIKLMLRMCLPAGPYVSDDDVKYIVETIKHAIA